MYVYVSQRSIQNHDPSAMAQENESSLKKELSELMDQMAQELGPRGHNWDWEDVKKP